MDHAPIMAEKEQRGSRADCSQRDHLIQKPEPIERAQPAAADEFATNPMARVAARFPDHDRNILVTEANSQREPRQSTANNVDWVHLEELE